MAAFAHLRREEKWGLGIAVALHVALVAALLVGSWRSPPKIPPAQRMTVSLADNVSLNSTAPKPSNASQAAVAPVLAPESAPLPAPTSVPVPAPVAPTVDRSPPKPAPTHAPAPKPTSAPEKHEKRAAQAGRQERRRQPPRPQFPQGHQLGPEQGQRHAGDRVRSGGPRRSIAAAMIRQIKPHWRAPEGRRCRQAGNNSRLRPQSGRQPQRRAAGGRARKASPHRTSRRRRCTPKTPFARSSWLRRSICPRNITTCGNIFAAFASIGICNEIRPFRPIAAGSRRFGRSAAELAAAAPDVPTDRSEPSRSSRAIKA